jgi:hypothetical protein
MAEITISGADVPKPTITIPIKKGGIFAYLAVTEAPSTNLSALQIRRISPIINAIMGKNKLLSLPNYQGFEWN